MLFCCDNCGCVDETELASPDAVELQPGEFLCSDCRNVIVDGDILPGEWHGCFPKEEYDPAQDRVCNRATGIGLS
jgi:hypothetical protein